jgi:folate-binding protein YgfZ
MSNIIAISKWPAQDLSSVYSLLSVAGSNVFNFLQGQLTCDLRMLDQRPSLFASICDLKGRIITTLYVAKHLEDYLLILPRSISSVVIDHLNKYAKISRVTVNNRDTEHCYGLWKQEQIALNFSPEFIFVDKVSATQKMLIFSEQPLPLSFHAAEEQWQLENLLAGYFLIYPETTGMFTPHWLNLPALEAVSFDKGCYLGQEIIARTHYLSQSQKRLIKYYLLPAKASATPGGKLYTAENTEIGHIIDEALLNSEHRVLAALLTNPEVSEVFWKQQLLKAYPHS